MQDVIVVSAFYRGQAVAVELARRGMSVTLLDLTHALGRWILEDVEGPFGYLADENLLPSQSEFLAQSDALIPVPESLTVWCESGPVELKGPTWPLHEPQWKPRLSQLQEAFGSSSFAAPEMAPLDLTRAFFVRHPTRPGFENSLDWCRRNQVRVVEQARIMDASASSRNILEAFEIQKKDEKSSEILRASQFLWALSLAETAFIQKNLVQKMFKGSIFRSELSIDTYSPDWNWVRFRVHLSAGPGRAEIPECLWLLKDWKSPWTHSESLILRRTPSDEQFDLWAMIPHLQRFNSAYLHHLGERILGVLRGRFPGLQAQVSEQPLAAEKSAEETGPARLPVWNRRPRLRLRHKNVEHLGWESLQGLGMNHLLKAQRERIEILHSVWKKQKEAEAKRQAKQPENPLAKNLNQTPKKDSDSDDRTIYTP
jgi:hypothetical protein